MDLVVSVLQEARDDRGYMAGFAITDQLILAAGGTSSRHPVVLASSNARHFERRKTPRELGLRDVLAIGDALWCCGEYGQLAVSRDQGATWRLFETGTDACLFGLAFGPDGAVWVVGDGGYAARVLGDRAERVDLQTSARLAAVYAVRDEMIVLAGNGELLRYRDGQVTVAKTGATRPLTALAISKHGTWLVTGDGGFIARSPDGAWFTRVKTGVEVDLEAIVALADGRLIAVGDGGAILISTDEGRTWKPHDSGTAAHLWSVERFGGGVLIGGDDGLVLKLAPPDDRTWADRVNVYRGAHPLDEVFARGPQGFVASGLRDYLDALADPGEGAAIDAETFERTYGVPLPDEVARLLAALDGRDAASAFEELTLAPALEAGGGDANLFEQLVVRDQEAPLGTRLVDAFCGVFCLGAQSNGDTYHMELYPWDGPRQVLHFDHETHAFTGVLADSLDSLVYLASLANARDAEAISHDTYALGLRTLHGRVAPTWHFEIGEGFTALDAKRRDTEFFFYRSRWICALLENAGADIARLFNADFNQVVPEDQLPARFEACEKFIPTALYSIWRAFLFDEPELARYLEIGRQHRARLVRDAARLVDELRAGRNQLGTIQDVGAWLAAFRALDLDPRRAEQRRAEAEARAAVASARAQQVAAELDRTPSSGWDELAWRWLDDGAAHRALLARLADAPEMRAQLAALDSLRAMTDDEREVALPRIAAELAPVLEPMLVGALVRDDQLQLTAAAADEDDDGEAPGWQAIDRALAPVYGDTDPHAHYGTAVPYRLGGNDPIHGISVYLRSAPVPHFHLVTYGFTDLFEKETDDPEESGFGFELTLRLRRAPDDEDVPTWALSFLQNLARYVFGTGNRFGAGHKMGLNGPIAIEHDTAVTAILFAADPELGPIESPFGSAKFLQIVGITDDEYRLIQEWSTGGLVEILQRKLPLLVTDLARGSVLDDPAIRDEVQRRVEAEGSSEDLTFAGEMTVEVADGRVRIEMGALYAAALPRAMRGRLRHGREYTMRGRNAVLQLQPGDACAGTLDDGTLVLTLTPETAAELEARMAQALAGSYRFETCPALEIVVTTSFIRDQAGTAVEVRGVEDPDEARRLIAEENARDDHDEDDAADDDEDDDDALDDEDYLPPPERLTAALRMTERALRLSPAEQDAQFTHAMLLIDAERAGLPGSLDELVRLLPRFAAQVRLNIAVRVAKQSEEPIRTRFGEVVEHVLALSDLGDVPDELFGELGAAVIERAPEHIERLIPLFPAHVELLSDLAWKAIQTGQNAHAIAIYERLLDLPIPDDGGDRTNYLRALNNACVQAHAGKAYELAVRIADRAQPVAHENPYIFHSAACAYAAVGDYAKALQQVKLAIEHEYDHLGKVEVDEDLGPIRDWPEFKALFRDWRARQEGN